MSFPNERWNAAHTGRTASNRGSPPRGAPPRGALRLGARALGGLLLLGVSAGTGILGLIAVCGRGGRTFSPMAFCPYDPLSGAVMLTLATLSLGAALWCLSMSRRAGALTWFLATAAVIVVVAVATS